MKALRIEQERGRREASISRIKDMGDYELIHMRMGMNRGGHSDD